MWRYEEMSRFVFVGVILLMGGVIASVGDAFKRKVRKERLSLFNLRPKYTILLIAFFTGISISASTLTAIFLADSGVRQGIFRMEEIKKDLQQKRQELYAINRQLESTTYLLRKPDT